MYWLATPALFLKARKFKLFKKLSLLTSNHFACFPNQCDPTLPLSTRGEGRIDVNFHKRALFIADQFSLFPRFSALKGREKMYCLW